MYIIVYIPETYKIPCKPIILGMGMGVVLCGADRYGMVRYSMVWLSVSQFFLTNMLLEPK